MDEHELLALIAPRPLYIVNAEQGIISPRYSEFLSAKNAEPVYQLFGKRGLGVEQMPPVNTPVGDFIGFHIRPGGHVTDYLWEQYLRFADRHLRWKD